MMGDGPIHSIQPSESPLLPQLHRPPYPHLIHCPFDYGSVALGDGRRNDLIVSHESHRYYIHHLIIQYKGLFTDQGRELPLS